MVMLLPDTPANKKTTLSHAKEDSLIVSQTKEGKSFLRSDIIHPK